MKMRVNKMLDSHWRIKLANTKANIQVQSKLTQNETVQDLEPKFKRLQFTSKAMHY